MCILAAVLAGLCFPAGRRSGQWQTLFNGRDLTGWTVKCKPADQGKSFWRVEEGASSRIRWAGRTMTTSGW